MLNQGFKKTLELCTCLKYVGVFLDTKLSWQQQVEAKCRKAVVAFSQVHRAVGIMWGLTPKIVYWLYTAVIRPVINYAAVVWWPRVNLVTVKRQNIFSGWLASL